MVINEVCLILILRWKLKEEKKYLWEKMNKKKKMEAFGVNEVIKKKSDRWFKLKVKKVQNVGDEDND